ncbi:MAG: methionine--tRNA ligase subunit beta [Planctomycetes bacterium]|nr:methionine--tRNA ligase subunit beta [Planctomycetota bacterium]
MITFDEFKKLELKVAEVKSAEDHPDADKLTVMQIDVGGEQKQIVAGIKGHYSNEELVGKKIVVVNNLAPAKLRGVESNGMLLAAVAGDGAVVLLAPEKDVASGTAVS